MAVELSVIIVNWNGSDCIGRCLDSVPVAAAGLETESIVVDNGSTDSSASLVREGYPGVQVIENQENLGFGRGAQIGIDAAGGEFIALVNPDVVLGEGSLAHLVSFLQEHPGAAWVGPKVMQTDGRPQSGALKLDTLFEPLWLLPGAARLRRGRTVPEFPRRCGQLRGSCMVFRASMLREIGGMPCCSFHYGEEQVLGARFKERGYDVWLDPRCTVVHQMGHSARKRWSYEERRLAVRIGQTESMRATLTRPRFVVHNCLLEICLAPKLVTGLSGRGHRPGLVWSMMKVTAAAFRGPVTVPPGGLVEEARKQPGARRT